MRAKSLCLLLIILTPFALAVSFGWAKEPCYNYMIAYSFRDKAVYYTPIFVQDSKGISYNEEEYVADTATSLKMESAFQKFLQRELKVNSSDLTVSARVAFKKEQVAKDRLENEIGDFRFRGFTIKALPEFKYGE